MEGYRGKKNLETDERNIESIYIYIIYIYIHTYVYVCPTFKNHFLQH